MSDLPSPSPGSAQEAVEGPEKFLAALDEGLYRQTRVVLAAPEAAGSVRSAWIWLLVTLGLFVLASLGESFRLIGLLVLVLLFHECGHFLGMWLFGYRNVRMFFIPFFGAAVSGRKHAAPVWQKGIILLLGPLPGICVGLLLVLLLRIHRNSWPGDLVLMLLILNGFNLLPLVPLDGGRLVELLLFSRQAALSAGFQCLAACGMAALAWWSGTGFLWVLVVFLLIALPARYRRARLERLFAGNPARMPERFEDLDDRQHRELFGLAVLLNRMTRTPAGVAAAVRELHEHMVARPPGVLSWVALLLLYLGGWAGGIGGLWTLRANTEREESRVAAELVSNFEQVTDAIDALQRESQTLAAAAQAQPAAAARLGALAEQKNEEAAQEWNNLYNRWHSQPSSVQHKAVRLLLASTSPTGSHRLRFAEAMAKQLGIAAGE
jgi:Zn-dependent protease